MPKTTTVSGIEKELLENAKEVSEVRKPTNSSIVNTALAEFIAKRNNT